MAEQKRLIARGGVALAGLGLIGLAWATDLLEILARSRRLFGDEHPDTLSTRATLISVYREQGRLEEAIAESRGLIEAAHRVLAACHTSASIAERSSMVSGQDETVACRKLPFSVTP